MFFKISFIIVVSLHFAILLKFDHFKNSVNFVDEINATFDAAILFCKAHNTILGIISHSNIFFNLQTCAAEKYGKKLL